MNAPEADLDRRAWIVGAAGLGAALAWHAVGARPLIAQQQQSNTGPMEQNAYRPVLRPEKPNATPMLTDDARDALEHRIKCQCGCILDIYTCRTTDFTCQVSPAMHRDVLRLVAGGYDADEILAAFVEVYGEVAMTEPKKEGFNWAGYFAPSVAIATGAIAITMMLRKWASEARATVAARAAAAASGASASALAGAPTATAAVPGVSSEDLARLDRALREDG